MEIDTVGHALTYVESREEFSVYRARNGELVYLAHGSPPTRYAVDFWDLNLAEEWSEFVGSRYAFEEFLRATLEEPYVVDDIRWCEHCDDPVHTEDGSTVERDEFACEYCVDNYYSWCECCEGWFRETNGTMHDTSVCNRCLENGYSWCGECDGYYNDDFAPDHAHDDDDEDDDEDGCCCESGTHSFTIRNDGEEPLANDTQTTVTLPAGVIDAEGLSRIRQYLRDEDMWDETVVLGELGDRWQTREGNYTKRFSRAVYKQLARKVSPTVVSMIGTIAAEHSRPVHYEIDVTRDLNQPARDFYHSDSCWWQSYSSSRCTLKTNGGFGLRTYDQYNVTGRAWVMPLKLTDSRNLTPTFETLAPDAFVVFNGYGALEGYTAARIVSHMAGMTYRKIGFSCSPMYINSDTAYLIAPEDIAAPYTDGYLTLSVNRHSSLYDDERIHFTEKELIHA